MSIDRADIQNIYPLTPLQAGMYAHAETEPASDAYVEQWSLRARGALDPAAVESTWNALFARHEVFRTVFTPGDGQRPLQIVLRRRQVEFQMIDYATLGAAAQARALDEARVRDRARGFRLGTDPLVRVLVIRLGPLDWEIIWTHHHIILDGWSAALVQAEFLQLYADRVTGHPSSLPPAPSFSAFVKTLPAATDTGFWREYLSGVDAAAALPPATASRVPALARHVVTLSPDATARVTSLCRAEGVTLAAFVQAVWAIVLGRYANADEVVFGYVMSGRRPDLPGVERMVGLLINTLPVRVDQRPGETFRSMLGRVHRAAGDLILHQHDPLVEIQRACGVAARISHVVAVENYPADPAGGGPATGFEITTATSYDRTPYGFDLVVLPDADALHFRLSWDQAAHDDAVMVAIGGQLAHVIEAVLADPTVAPCTLNILPPDQWAAVVDAPNQTAADYPLASMAELFAARAAAHPDAPALWAPHESDAWMSYKQLRDRAHAIAAHLRLDLKIPHGSRVAVCAAPSTSAIAAVLGILGAGCAYVPVDPRYPAARSRYLIDDARVSAILGDAVDALPVDGVPVVPLASLPAADARTFETRTSIDDKAYVIYTSGSTGAPKGCEVTHRNVVRLIANDAPAVEFGAGDVWILAHSLSFDFSVWELFGPLLTGGRLIVPMRDVVQDVPAFRELLARGRVTVLNQTPLAFAGLMAVETGAPTHHLGEHLRLVIFGGDRLDTGTLAPWTRLYPLSTTSLVNMYGITETTVHVTHCRLTDADIARPPAQSPMGRALPETTVYVCDRHGNPQPIGAPGEMRVGGSGVCRGYLGRPELTAERFVPDVFSGAGRLYLSGDLAVRGTGGELYFIGRNDAQVKIRGHRIEPAEIERALLTIDGVAHAAVVVDRSTAGAELIACVQGDVTADAVRARVATLVPDYEVPSHIVIVAALPLTANGKLDRDAVKRLRVDAAREGSAAFEPPATDRERLLAGIWTEVLAVPRVGRHDRFISLGGDSIKSIQILARLRSAGLTLELKDLFRHPTVAELAPRLTERRATAPVADAGVPFALTPIQRRFFEAHPVDRAHFNHALLLRAVRAIDVTRLSRVLQALYDAHDTLRLRFTQQPDGTWRQQVSPRGEAVSLLVEDLSSEPDVVSALQTSAARVQASLDLAHGPIFRAVLYRRADADHLLLVVHHLAIDGVSWRILLEDLEAGLNGVAPLAPTDPYSRWSALVQSPERHRAVAAEWPFWRLQDEVGHDAAPAFGPAGVYADADERLIEWSVEDTTRLTRHACAAYNTNAGELLLAAVARALGRWTGRARLQVALESHGRDAVPGADTSHTVGWFTALYPFMLDLGDAPVGRRIRRLKEDLRQIPSGGAGYGILRYRAAAEARALTAQPAVSFNYLGELTAGSHAWFAPSSDPVGPSASPAGPRPFAIDIAAIVVDGRLRVAVTYSRAAVSDASMETFLQTLDAELHAVVDHCVGRRSELTPADLTHKGLSLDEFEGLFDED